MKILNLMKILLLCVMTAGLVSCGDDNYQYFGKFLPKD